MLLLVSLHIATAFLSAAMGHMDDYYAATFAGIATTIPKSLLAVGHAHKSLWYDEAGVAECNHAFISTAKCSNANQLFNAGQER